MPSLRNYLKLTYNPFESPLSCRVCNGAAKSMVTHSVAHSVKIHPVKIHHLITGDCDVIHGILQDVILSHTFHNEYLCTGLNGIRNTVIVTTKTANTTYAAPNLSELTYLYVDAF